MKSSELDYELPSELIAQRPIERRDHSRLLVYERATGKVRHRRFSELPEELAPGTLAGGAPLRGRTDLFITPGFEFERVDSLVTNFHLPRSTLLALVMAFAGVEETRRLYRIAVEERYRFYSFGDAMLVL